MLTFNSNNNQKHMMLRLKQSNMKLR